MQCATADPDGRKRALLIGGGIANFTDVAATFNGIIRALREKVHWMAHSRILANVVLLGTTYIFSPDSSPHNLLSGIQVEGFKDAHLCSPRWPELPIWTG